MQRKSLGFTDKTWVNRVHPHSEIDMLTGVQHKYKYDYYLQFMTGDKIYLGKNYREASRELLRIGRKV
jgi:hypothetical protein